MRRLVLLFACELGLIGCAGSALAGNPIYDELTTAGLKISATETVKLPPPTLADGLAAADQRQAIEGALQKRYTWEEFTRNAVVAPFYLKIADEKEGTVARQVDAYFIAYGDLQKLNADDPLTGTLASGGGGEKSDDTDWTKPLAKNEAAKRDLPMNGDFRLVAGEMSLFEKVRLSIFTESSKSLSADSMLIASVLTTDKLKEYPSQWRSIGRDDAGRRQLGPPQPYSGMGGYLKVTKLAAPAGALFLECHLVFAEPEGWFNGANLLRSKLPIKFQDSVRKARRDIAKQSGETR